MATNPTSAAAAAATPDEEVNAPQLDQGPHASALRSDDCDSASLLVMEAAQTPDVNARKRLIQQALDLEIGLNSHFDGIRARRSALLQRLKCDDANQFTGTEPGQDRNQNSTGDPTSVNEDALVPVIAIIDKRVHDTGPKIDGREPNPSVPPRKDDQKPIPAQPSTPKPPKSKRPQDAGVIMVQPKTVVATESIRPPQKPSTPSVPSPSETQIYSPRSSLRSGSSSGSTLGRNRPRKLEIRSSGRLSTPTLKKKKPKKLEIRAVK